MALVIIAMLKPTRAKAVRGYTKGLCVACTTLAHTALCLPWLVTEEEQIVDGYKVTITPMVKYKFLLVL